MASFNILRTENGYFCIIVNKTSQEEIDAFNAAKANAELLYSEQLMPGELMQPQNLEIPGYHLVKKTILDTVHSIDVSVDENVSVQGTTSAVNFVKYVYELNR